jgi:colicin import membrane protein
MATLAHSTPVSLLVRRRDAAFGRFLFWSTLFHAVLFALAVVWAELHQTPSVDLNQTPIKATLVRQGTPRDEKLLPRIEELPPPPPEQKAPEPAPVPEPPKTVALPSPIPTPAPPKPRQQGEKNAETKQKLFGAFDKMSHSKKPQELSGEANGDPAGDAAKSEGEVYFARLSSQVKRFYDVSQTIPDAERTRLNAQVALFITSSGELQRARLARSSGNDLFDSAVLAAVKRASPFSPPPPHLRDSLQKYGVVLQFRP